MNKPAVIKPASQSSGSTGPEGGTLAFTLIELLVVIGVIAILAALTIGILPSVAEKRARHVATTHLQALTMAIQSYHADLNAYPPDHPTNAARPPLFYELTGTSPDNEDNPTAYRSLITGETLAVGRIQAAFGRGGFLNSGAGDQKARNYLPGLKVNQFTNAPDASDIDYLVVPVKGPTGDFNPWHYNSSSPTNNPNSYDLWVFIQPRDKIIRIGN